MKIAILGFAGQGQSSFEYWNRDGNEITICDKDINIDIPAGAQAQLGDDYLKDLNNYDLLIRTPALHPKEIINANDSQILEKVWSNTNEFLKVCPSKNVIGVTGTKGKGTTSTLITKMLEAAGKTVHLGGNIGTPPLDLLKNEIQPDDWVVLELANFQLIDLKHSPHIAICLMVEPEHMDWHEDLEEYIAAKQQLFINQTEANVAIYYDKNENSHSIAAASIGTLIPYFAAPGAFVEDEKIKINGIEICNVNEIKLLGKHNWQNACAAVTALWQIDQNEVAAKSVLTSFGGLPFRIEFRKEVNGVRFYNDSFATAPGAAIAAIKSIDGMKVLIIGGHDRMLDLTELANEIVENQESIRKVILIGASAMRTADALMKKGYENYVLCTATTMQEIVAKAVVEAQTGDAVVLSPSFASFGLFKNFEDRGNQFNQAVEAL